MLEPFEDWMKGVLEKCRLIWNVIQSPLPEMNEETAQDSAACNTAQPPASEAIRPDPAQARRFDELLEQRAALQAHVLELQNRQQETDAQQAQALESIQQECRDLQAHNQELSQANQALENELNSARRAGVDLVMSVIYYRDRLFTQLEMVGGEEAGVGARVLKSMLSATEQILRDNHVRILRDGGAFSVNSHETAAIEPTDRSELDGQIASTTREGYLYRDQLLRRQQVIVYQYREPDETQA